MLFINKMSHKSGKAAGKKRAKMTVFCIRRPLRLLDAA
jgi:hypothetical protein